MPGKVKFKRASIVATLLATTVLLTACAGADHTWRGEFDARLEAASTAIEARLPELQPESSFDEMFKAGIRLGPELEFKGELIGKMNAPDGCEAVQEEGLRKVTGTAQFSDDLYKNLTPFLRHEASKDLGEKIAELEALEREAAHCETS